MQDALLLWGADLGANPTGDIYLAGDNTLGQQRVLRRLLTNPADYIWHPAYGAGLGQFVGQTDVANSVAGIVYLQLLQEPCVAIYPLPKVSATSTPDGNVAVNISYCSAPDTATQMLTFSMST